MDGSLIQRWWANEPARFWSAVVLLVNSVIALLVALDVMRLSGPQVALVYLVVLNAAVVLAGEQVRSRVSPTGRQPVDPEPPADL